MEGARQPIHITLAADVAGQRLDKALAAALEGLSRVRLQALIAEGRILVDGAAAQSASRRVAGGEKISIDIPPPKPLALTGEDIPLAILYEDADLIVLDKPAGLVVHPAPGHHGGTLVNALLAHCQGRLSGIGGVERPGIVHRLDKDTSGVMIVAKSDAAHQGLAQQFAAHDIDRAYTAIVWGRPTPLAGRIEGAIGRHSRDRKKMAVVASGQGRSAATRYRVERVFGPAAKPFAAQVGCTLETGRTHQVRVHMASIGHPLIGDSYYGGGRTLGLAAMPVFPRQALHARRLALHHPVTGTPLVFETPPPADMQALIAALEDEKGTG